MTDSARDAANDVPIVGSLVLTASDNLWFLFSRLNRLLSIAVLTATIVGMVIWWLARSNQQSDHYLTHPLLGFKTFLSNMLPIILGYAGLFVAVAVFCSWLSFRRMPQANRTLNYRADLAALKTSDASGAELTLPWALVRRARVTKQLLLMQLTTRAWRFLPLRAFSADDQRRLIAIALRSANKT
jgi:hypothetical protein